MPFDRGLKLQNRRLEGHPVLIHYVLCQWGQRRCVIAGWGSAWQYSCCARLKNLILIDSAYAPVHADCFGAFWEDLVVKGVQILDVGRCFTLSLTCKLAETVFRHIEQALEID